MEKKEIISWEKNIHPLMKLPTMTAIFTGAMKIPALLAVVIKVSEEQTELLGRDAAYVARFSLGWVITNYEIEIHRLPKSW